jgi:uncharacterized protein YlxW (UPF0749 family)
MADERQRVEDGPRRTNLRRQRNALATIAVAVTCLMLAVALPRRIRDYRQQRAMQHELVKLQAAIVSVQSQIRRVQDEIRQAQRQLQSLQ